MHRKRFLAACSTLLLFTGASASYAAPAGSRVVAADPCAVHLPPELAFTSGPGITNTNLRGQGSMNLTTMQAGFYEPGFKPPAHDRLAEFFFRPSGSNHHFAGPLSSFAHGNSTHFCVNQKLYIDFSESGNGNHGLTNVHIDGMAVGRSVHLTVWVMGHTYRLAG